MNTVEMQKSLFVANAMQTIGRQNTWEQLKILDDLLKLNKESPLKPADWYFGLSEMQRKLYEPAPMGGLAKVDAWNDSLIAWIGNVFPIASNATDQWRQMLRDNPNVRSRASSLLGSQLYAKGVIFKKYAYDGPKILSELFDQMGRDQTLADYWDLLVSRDFGSAKDTPEQLVQRNPSLLAVRDALSQAENEEDVRQNLAAAVQSVSNVVKFEQPSDPVAQSILDLRSDLGRLAKEANDRLRAAEEEVRQKSAESALRGLVAVYRIFGGNETTTKQLTFAIESYTSMRSAIRSYNEAIASGSSMAVASFNVVSIWIQLFSSFQSLRNSDQNGKYEEYVAEMLSQIVRQIVQIQSTITQGFLSLDDRLTEVSKQVESGFTALARGIEKSQWQLDEVMTATSNLASQVLHWDAAVIDRLDYLIEQEDVKRLLEGIEYMRRFGEPLSKEDFHDACTAASNIVIRSSEQRSSGVQFSNLEQNVDDWLRFTHIESLQIWPSHANSYVSLLAIFGSQVDSERLSNPMRWLFAVRALIQVLVNSCNPAQDIPSGIAVELRDEGTRWLNAFSSAVLPNFERVDPVSLAVNFLLQRYVASVASVAEQVKKIHLETLRTSGAHIEELGAYAAFKRSIEVESELPAVRAKAPNEIRPLPKVKYTDDSERLPQELIASSPIFQNTLSSAIISTNWPDELIAPASVWESFDQEARMNACVITFLGAGKAVVSYQGQFEDMRLSSWYRSANGTALGDIIVGKPAVHFRVTVNGLRVGESSIWLSGDSSAEAFVMSFQGNSIFPSDFKIEEALASTNCTAIPKSSPLLHEDLADEHRRLRILAEHAYSMRATEIKAALLQQLSSSVSSLGEAATRLTNSANAVRGLISMMFDLLVLEAPDLRHALYGAVAPIDTNSQNLESESNVRITNAPLLDLKALLSLISTPIRSDGTELPLTEASSTSMLLGLPSIGADGANNLLRAFSSARSNARSINWSSTGLDIREALDNLRRVSRGTP